jgi:SAM-dependent methyltransferase
MGAVVDRIDRRGCEVCGATSADRLVAYGSEEWPVVRCTNCGFVFLQRAPQYAELAEEQAWEVNHAAEAERRKKVAVYRLDYATRFRLGLGKKQERSRLARVLGNARRVLDVGCGSSVRVPEGPSAFGIEISAKLAREADPLFRARGGRVHCGPALEGMRTFDNDFFSAILMRSYLEHEVAPRAVLEAALGKLAPGGVILVKVPNYDCIGRHVMGRRWCGFRLPDHVNYFTPKSLRRLAESIGYRWRLDMAFAGLDDNMHVVLTRPA